MTSDERIDKLAKSLEDLERITRQGFATLTELYADTRRDMVKLHAETQRDMVKLHAETQREMAERHAETQREIAATNLAVKEMSLAIVKFENSVSALLDHVANHETRITQLEEGN